MVLGVRKSLGISRSNSSSPCEEHRLKPERARMVLKNLVSHCPFRGGIDVIRITFNFEDEEEEDHEQTGASRFEGEARGFGRRGIYCSSRDGNWDSEVANA